MKRKRTKSEVVETISAALVMGTVAIRQLKALKLAVHEYLGYDKPPKRVLKRVHKAMGYLDV